MPDRVRAEIEVHMQRLIHLTLDSALLIKPSFYSYVPRCIDALIQILTNAPRPLTAHEKDAIQDLHKIKKGFIDGKLVPPVGSSAAYSNYIDAKRSTNDIPGAKELFF